MSWIFVAAVPALPSDCSAPAGDPSATSRTTDTASGSSRPGCKTDRSTRRRSGMTSECSTGDPGVDAWISSLRDSHASPSPAPESEREPPTSGGCGPALFESFARWDPATSCWKTFQACLFEDMDLATFSANWPRSGMTRSGNACRLRPLVRHICVTASSSLPTPRAAEKNDCQRDRGEIGKERLTLTGRVRRGLLPTPTALDADSGRINRSQSQGAADRPTPALAVRMQPTPKSSDYRSGIRERNDAMAGRRVASPRASDAERGAWSTPKRPLSTRPLCEQIGGRLNPEYVEWLMGVPRGWTALEPLAMPCSPRSENGSEEGSSPI